MFGIAKYLSHTHWHDKGVDWRTLTIGVLLTSTHIGKRNAEELLQYKPLRKKENRHIREGWEDGTSPPYRNFKYKPLSSGRARGTWALGMHLHTFTATQRRI